MKKTLTLILTLLMASPLQAGWFDKEDKWKNGTLFERQQNCDGLAEAFYALKVGLNRTTNEFEQQKIRREMNDLKEVYKALCVEDKDIRHIPLNEN